MEALDLEEHGKEQRLRIWIVNKCHDNVQIK